MEKQSHLANAQKYGLMMGAILIIVSLVLYLAGMVDLETGKAGFLGTFLSYVISIGAVVMGIMAYKKNNGNFLSLGDALKQGMIIGIIGGLIVAIYNIIFFQFIEPDLLDNIREASLEQAEERGQVNSDTEDTMNNMMNIFISPGFIFVVTVVMKFFLGLIVGLIAGAIMKNEKPITLDDV